MRHGKRRQRKKVLPRSKNFLSRKKFIAVRENFFCVRDAGSDRPMRDAERKREERRGMSGEEVERRNRERERNCERRSGVERIFSMSEREKERWKELFEVLL